jgi:hypothetical protein
MFKLEEKVERARSFERMQRESRKRNILQNQEKTIVETKSQEAPKGKPEIWEYVMGKDWLVVGHIVHC